MEFHSPQEALLVLGLKIPSSKEEVKNAYRELSKQYHPDSCKSSSLSWQYYDITAAYEYMMHMYETLEQPVPSLCSGKVFGNAEEIRRQSAIRQSKEQLRRKEKQMEKRHREEEQILREQAIRQRQEETYERTMQEIHTIRAAEITAQIIQSMLTFEQNPSESSD